MSGVLRPESAEEVADAVAWAAAERRSVEVVGHGTKRGIGRPVQAQETVDLAGLTGVTLYEPEELVVSVLAGTPIASLERLLGAHNQMLAFEPMDFGPLIGASRGRGTVGGTLAANAAGPRRIKAGAARDHVLGVTAISGRGESFKAGGRVVKNVTGYDLPKGLAGSWGTLAVITEATLKVLPRPETTTTLVAAGLDDAAAIAALCRAMGTPWDVSGAAYLPEAVVAEVPDAAFATGGQSAALLRLEGFGPSVDARAEKMTALIGRLAPIAVLEAEASEALWRSVRDVEAFSATTHPVWRVSVAPNAGPAVVAAIGRRRSVRHFYDWSGGLIWLEAKAEDGDDTALAREIRVAVAACGGGHATLYRGSQALRTEIPVFEPQTPALAALSRRLKAAFDPLGILNPGRMGTG